MWWWQSLRSWGIVFLMPVTVRPILDHNYRSREQVLLIFMCVVGKCLYSASRSPNPLCIYLVQPEESQSPLFTWIAHFIRNSLLMVRTTVSIPHSALVFFHLLYYVDIWNPELLLAYCFAVISCCWSCLPDFQWDEPTSHRRSFFETSFLNSDSKSSPWLWASKALRILWAFAISCGWQKRLRWHQQC